MPSVAPVQGRYAVYERVITVTAPSALAPTTSHVARTYTTVNADGSFTRVDSGTALSRKITRRFDPQARLLDTVSIDQTCAYSPAYAPGIARGTAVGQSFSASTTVDCAVPSGSPYTYTSSVNSIGQAMESRTTPAGTFNTFKYQAQYVTTSSSAITTGTETCWIDTATALTVRCESSFTSVPSDTSVAPSSSNTVLELVGLSSNSGSPVGSALPRFVGLWGVTFAGSGNGRCSALSVNTSGGISGSCQTMDSLGTVTSTFTVTGSVDVNGVVTAAGSDGSTLSGNLTSPLGGSGTWTRGSATGTWSASHW